MKVAVWNCRGAGGPLTIPQLKEGFHGLGAIHGREGEVKERLDRCLRSVGWMQVYEKRGEKNKMDPGCIKLPERIKECRVALIKWNRTAKGNAKLKIQEIKEQLKVTKEARELCNRGVIATLKIQLSKAYRKKSYIGVRSPEADGSMRGTKTLLFSIKVSWLKGNETESVFSKNLMGNGVGATRKLRRKCLIKPVDEGEIKQTIFSMFPNKAPGVDGMSPCFSQSYWSIINVDIVHGISTFFHTGILLKTINETIISLVPKVDNPVMLANFRPISLCNVLYKSISKILANRLKKVLKHCISPSQSAFVLGQQILDNVIIAHEILHFLKRLSNLIKKVVDNKHLTGIKICKDSPMVSHLFFADESLLCCKASKKEAQKLKDVLKIYGQASGQVVNFDKSAMFFSGNSPKRVRGEISKVLDNMKEMHSGKYLGLPMTIGRDKNQEFGISDEQH
nr:uncharacterized protein LOC113737168 [Coffea arabica]